MFEERMAPIEAHLSSLHGFPIKFAAVLCLDHSSGHTAMADCQLDAKNMNRNPGGKKGTLMRDTIYVDALNLKGKGKGKKYKQKMVVRGKPIGAAQCAEERGVKNVQKKKLDELVEVLSAYNDFQEERISGRWVERDVAEWNKEHKSQHAILWIPKFSGGRGRSPV